MVTSPEEGLWGHIGRVSKEDINHMKSRFEAFRCTAKVAKFTDVDPCSVHMCKWIVEGAQAADAAAALRSSQPAVVLPTASKEAARPGAPGAAAVTGVAELGREAELPEEAVSALLAELTALGAAHVAELEVEDWEGMEAFKSLKKLEQRRLLKAVGPVG